MRIAIRHLSHAKRYGKIGKQVLLDHLIAPEGARLPTQRTRNAIMRGFGYSSYNEVEHLMTRPGRVLPPMPSDEQLMQAYTRGFGFALVVAAEHGFAPQSDPESLPSLLATKAVQAIQSHQSPEPK